MSNAPVEKFTGTTLEAAIELINSKWGPEAAILHVERQVSRGSLLSPSRQWVEVTARAPEKKVEVPQEIVFTGVSTASIADDLPFPASFANTVYAVKKESELQNSIPAARMEDAQPKETSQDPMIDYLIEKGINSEDAMELITDWKKKNPAMDLDYCISDLDRRIPRLGWKEIFPIGKSRCTLLVGLPGAGKTSSLIKMAARLKLDHKSEVLILSADLSRAGPSQELALYGEILQIPIVQIFDLAETKNAIQDVTSNTQILVDWCGISPYDPQSFKALENFRTSHPNTQILITASLVSDLRLWKRIRNQFSNLPLVGLTLTQTDLEYRLGKIWEGVRGTNLPLTFISTGKNVPGDIYEGIGFPFGKLLFKDYQGVQSQTNAKDLVA